MHTFSTPSFSLFREDRRLLNIITIVVITAIFYAVGAMLRLVEELSLFWPLNGVMAGVFARYVWLNRLHYYAVCYLTMLGLDALTTEWGTASLVINLSNMVFIAVVALFVLRDKKRPSAAPGPLNALKLFAYCMIGALLCGLLGAAGSVSFNSLTFVPLVADWFGEQFSTGVLIVPCILTLSWPRSLPVISLRQVMPLVALIASMIASVAIGGAGSLAFPLPALIWCAIRYSLPATCLLTFVTGATEVILVANSIIDISVASPLQTPQMFSARLGIATMAVCPVIVSTSVAAINSLMNQVSLRADYDYLTRVYSRSGLYEALQKRPFTTGQHMTVMLLDIDYFKNINDNYGHECGDRVLAAFASEVQQAVGEQSMVARMGGEEFAVVVTTTEPLKGVHLAESVRQRIENTPFHWRNQTLFITVSIGVAKGRISQGQSTSLFNQLLADADEFLYRSKKGGRNRISSRELEQETPVLDRFS